MQKRAEQSGLALQLELLRVVDFSLFFVFDHHFLEGVNVIFFEVHLFVVPFFHLHSLDPLFHFSQLDCVRRPTMVSWDC